MYPVITFILILLSLSVSTSAQASTKYIFDDEFKGASLSPSWMAMNVYDNVNDEEQCYIPSQITVKDGYLNSTAIAQKTSCSGTSKNYASGAVAWAAPMTFKYGTVEYRAKFAGGTGTWPAIWLVGYKCQSSSPAIYGAYTSTCKWPQMGSNEIDITEIKGGDFTHPWQNVINPSGSWFTCQPIVSDVTKNFHTYKFTWTPDRLTWYIDGVQTCQQTDPSYIPSTPMYMIINTAVGGDGGGTVIDSTLPQTTQVQYVRVTPYSADAK